MSDEEEVDQGNDDEDQSDGDDIFWSGLYWIY